ncbi:hypothetical protein T484DRAFT_1650688, partial [Baffinella frigidus]
MRIWFLSGGEEADSGSGFEATWDKGVPEVCDACQEGTYKTTKGSQECLACPRYTSSAVGSKTCT